MKVLIDMNLSPLWVAAFSKKEIEATHWASIGDPTAPNDELKSRIRILPLH